MKEERSHRPHHSGINAKMVGWLCNKENILKRSLGGTGSIGLLAFGILEEGGRIDRYSIAAAVEETETCRIDS